MIEIKVNEKELDILMQCVLLGNYIINGNKRERLKEYDDIVEKMSRLKYESLNNISGKEAEDNELADLRDKTYDSVSKCLDSFENDTFLEKLAKIIANLNYPIKSHDDDSINTCWAAEMAYTKLLKEQGLSFVSISAPAIDDKLKTEKD